MPVDRSDITDANGRHIPVTRGRGAVHDNSGLSSNRRGRRPSAEPLRRDVQDFKRSLDELSSRVRRLAPPDGRNPERFHEERSAIARELQKLAERLP